VVKSNDASGRNEESAEGLPHARSTQDEFPAREPVLGSDSFLFRPVREWGALPDNWELGDVAAVATHLDRVYVFQRGVHPMLVFNRAGDLIDSWGDGIFTRPHGVHIGSDGTVFCTDDGDHSVRSFTPDGRLLMTIGDPGHPSPFQGGNPFNRCTHTALTPDGDILVSDGYGNARVHRFSPTGTLIESWGSAGSGPGEFNLPHNISCDDDGWVYVADRENHRIQVFDSHGRYQTQWNNLHRPSAMHMVPGPSPRFYLGEIGPYLSSNHGWPNLGPRVSMLSNTGELLGRLDSPVREPDATGAFVSPHGIAVDLHGDMYVADVCRTGWPSLFPNTTMPANIRGLHKFERVSA
jgi:DNA-binding beta-propeller fold protein YncE